MRNKAWVKKSGPPDRQVTGVRTLVTRVKRKGITVRKVRKIYFHGIGVAWTKRNGALRVKINAPLIITDDLSFYVAPPGKKSGMEFSDDPEALRELQEGADGRD